MVVLGLLEGVLLMKCFRLLDRYTAERISMLPNCL